MFRKIIETYWELTVGKNLQLSLHFSLKQISNKFRLRFSQPCLGSSSDAFSQWNSCGQFSTFLFSGDRQTSLQIHHQSNRCWFGKENLVHQFDCAYGQNPRKLPGQWKRFCVSNLRQRTISSKQTFPRIYMTHSYQGAIFVLLKSNWP